MQNHLRYSYAFNCLILERGERIYYFKDWDHILRTMKYFADLDRDAGAAADARLTLREPPERIQALLDSFKGEVKKVGKKTSFEFKEGEL